MHNTVLVIKVFNILPMPKEKNKISKIHSNKKGKSTYSSPGTDDVVVDTEIVDEEVEETEELDPEVLEALNVKKKQKIKQTNGVDYIPELERGDEDIIGADDDL